jgi:hypothetical protein
MASNTFPEDWRDQPCFLVAVPRPLAPFVGGLMKIAEQRGFWASDTDYSRGYTAVIEFEGCLMAMCLDVLLESNDRLYRMLDLALYGKEYEVVSTDPLVVEPGIPAVHEAIYQDGFGLMYMADRLTQLVDNSINGTVTPIYTDATSVKALLQGIIDALSADDADFEEIISKLTVIAGLLA